MLMESMNLAASWKLPVIFVCKDNEWAITTKSESVTGGGIRERAVGFGLEYFSADGRDFESTTQSAIKAIDHARNGNGPAFLHAACAHLEGHFLGDALLNMTRKPIESLTKRVAPMVASMTKANGASFKERTDALGAVMSMVLDASTSVAKDNDPLAKARPLFVRDDAERLKALEERLWSEIQRAVAQAM
jgi:pyruvate dehydrogenase E1 component alpha subunit